MRYQPMLLACTAFAAVLACGDGAVDPGDGGNGQEMAARFEHLADSVEGEGYSPTADALRHAAEIVRLTGRATPVQLTIDDQARSFLAVAEQLDFPSLECTWPGDSGVVVPGDSTVVVPGASGVGVPGDSGGVVPGDSGVIGPPPEPVPPPGGSGGGGPGECREVGTYSMRTLIAWEPENMAEVVRIVTDLGSTEVAPGVPDVMTELPAREATGADGETPPAPGDTGGGGGGGGGSGYPGFMGEYLVRDVGSWWAVEGSQTNAALEIAGACTNDRVTFDWAEFRCDAARFRFEFRMRVEPLRYDPLTGRDPGPEPAEGGPEGNHELALGSSDVAGVRLTVVAWTPPPLPPGEPRPDDPTPVDSTGVAGGF